MGAADHASGNPEGAGGVLEPVENRYAVLPFTIVIPAQAGIQTFTRGSVEKTHVAADAALTGFTPARE
jgi:hypothetical protein